MSSTRPCEHCLRKYVRRRPACITHQAHKVWLQGVAIVAQCFVCCALRLAFPVLPTPRNSCVRVMLSSVELQHQALMLAGGDPELAAKLLQEAAEHAEQIARVVDVPSRLPEVIDMIDWASTERRCVGFWSHVGRTELEHGFWGEYVPHNKHGHIMSVAEGADDYWRFHLPIVRSKVMYSRQLLQDLRKDPLTAFDIHHENGKAENCLKDLGVELKGPHRAKHGREGGAATRNKGKGPGGKRLKRFR